MFIKIYKSLIKFLYPTVINKYIQSRIKKGKEDINRFNERIGRPTLTRPEGKLVWMHGASVGESISMLPLISQLLKEDPKLNIMVTTGTVTSAEIMAKRLPKGAFHQYFPIDNPIFTTRFIKYWHPDLVLWFESEFWPSILSSINRKKIPLLLVNGRISDKSFKRWQQLGFVIKEILGYFTLCLGQSDEDARRLQVLGAKDAICLGNLKYAGLPLPLDKDKRQEVLNMIKDRKVWVVSSTHHDEELKIGKILPKLKKNFPDLLTIIAPRHPHRGAEIKQKLEEEIKLNVSLRSKAEPITEKTDVYVADTLGELGIWYNISDIVFIGGSLIPHGGQNFMEPSRDKCCVLVGPHMHNFADCMTRAKKADAIIQVNDTQELLSHLENLLSDEKTLKTKCKKAYDWTVSEGKVLDDIVKKVKDYIGENS